MSEPSDLTEPQDTVDDRLTRAEDRLGALEREVEVLREEIRSATSVLGTSADPRP